VGLCFKNIRILASQANKVIYTIRFINCECNNGLSVQSLFASFDKLMLSILVYGCEIWGYTIRDEFEKVHRKFCKYVYVFNLKYLQLLCLEKCGRLSLSIHFIFRSMKYWIRLVTGHNVYTYSCYNLLKRLSDADRVICCI